jgi:hypothetical protein
MSNAMTEPPYLEALRQQEQADMDGTMVRVSRQAVDEAIADIERLRAALRNPPRHKYWGAGEPDCPRDIKASNGELHSLRCKVCGETSPRNEICLVAALGEPKL